MSDELFIVDATINGRADGFHTIGVFTTEALAKAHLETFLTMMWGQTGWQLVDDQYVSPYVDYGLNAGGVMRVLLNEIRKTAVDAAEAHNFWRLRDGGHHRKANTRDEQREG